jgi:hypothetical protein
MRIRSIPQGWTVVAVITALALPAAAAAQETPTETESSKPETVDVRVENNNWLDMHVYALTAHVPSRSLGVVSAHSTQVFHLPAAVTVAGTELRVVADPIGSTDIYVSDEVLANPASDIVVTLQASLPLSTTVLAPRRHVG